MKTIHIKKISSIPKSYEALCRWHLPRPLHDQADLDNATEIVDCLVGHELNLDQEDYLGLLSDLIENYEAEHFPLNVKPLGGLETLRYLLGENNLSAADLSRILGADRTVGAKILREERKPTLSQIKKLAAYFVTSPEIFL